MIIRNVVRYDCPVCHNAMHICDPNGDLGCFCGHRAPAGSIEPFRADEVEIPDDKLGTGYKFWLNEKGGGL